jgi:hypothetical protein
MVKTKLVGKLITDGASVLCELDRRNFPVESMFWIHLPDQDYWRLIIASSVVTEHGGAAAYRRLGELLRGIELAGTGLEDISLLAPESPQFRSFFSLAKASSRLAAGDAWLELDEATVYRWTGASVSGDLTCDVPRGELNHFWETERKLSNLPVLLIALDNRRVTLRFHPQHGPLDGIENVKQDFAIGLHRSRPDCQIKWAPKPA